MVFANICIVFVYSLFEVNACYTFWTTEWIWVVAGILSTKYNLYFTWHLTDRAFKIKFTFFQNICYLRFKSESLIYYKVCVSNSNSSKHVVCK
jgi:hypothetical protein